MKVTHYGHACVLIDIAGTRLLFDPGTLSTGLDDATDLSAILLSHGHDDHVDPELLARLMERNPGAVVYAEPELAADLRHSGVIPATPGTRLDVGGTFVEVLGGTHAPVFGDFPGTGNVAFLVGDGAFLHPGDSFEVPPGDVAVLALPTSGPWIKVADAIAYARRVAPSVVVPIHEAALSSTDTVFAMLEGFLPEGTAFVPPKRGVPIEIDGSAGVGRS